jgi:hypothetical protein
MKNKYFMDNKHLGTLTTLDLLGFVIVPRSFILKGNLKAEEAYKNVKQ